MFVFGHRYRTTSVGSMFLRLKAAANYGMLKDQPDSPWIMTCNAFKELLTPHSSQLMKPLKCTQVNHAACMTEYLSSLKLFAD